ncbi:MAG TPA: hypothetical protein DIT07_10550 [Sphingobacteriaceae bacterium]|nr:hypothetical protein [Sphingobacteriaceae bacterium]
MALNPTLKKVTACVLLVSCINLTASAAVMSARQQFQTSELSKSKPQETVYTVSLDNVTKAESIHPDKEKKKKKAIIWIIAGAAVIVAIILLAGKKSAAPSGNAV